MIQNRKGRQLKTHKLFKKSTKEIRKYIKNIGKRGTWIIKEKKDVTRLRTFFNK